MARLLIDNSNTRTKFALSDGAGSFADVFWLPTADLTQALLAETLGGLEFDAALIASVVPKTAELLDEFLRGRPAGRAGLQPATAETPAPAGTPVHRLDHRSPLGLDLDYPKPEQIGADRLANAVGVVARHGAPAVVIDFGTAVTFDVVGPGPAYRGGVIAPGLGAMNRYLGRRTALLPEFDLAEPEHAIGRSTEEAMRAGAVIGYRGLVREILAAVRRELGVPATAVATGGDAALIARGVAEIDAVDPELTLHGLDEIARRVFG